MLTACAVPIKAPPEVKISPKVTLLFVEAVRSELDQSLGLLLVKLYRRNPVQLPTNTTIEVRVEQLKAARLNLQEFDRQKPDQLVRMAFHLILQVTGLRLLPVCNRW